MSRMSTRLTSAHCRCALLAYTYVRNTREHLVPPAQGFLQGMVDDLKSGKTDGLPAILLVLTELLEVCLAGTMGTEQWVFLAHVVDATTAALFHLPNGIHELRARSGLFIELCLRALEHIASGQTVDLRVRRLARDRLAGVGRGTCGVARGRCGLGQVRSGSGTGLALSVRTETSEAGANGVHWVSWPRRDCGELGLSLRCARVPTAAIACRWRMRRWRS